MQVKMGGEFSSLGEESRRDHGGAGTQSRLAEGGGASLRGSSWMWGEVWSGPVEVERMV